MDSKISFCFRFCRAVLFLVHFAALLHFAEQYVLFFDAAKCKAWKADPEEAKKMGKTIVSKLTKLIAARTKKINTQLEKDVAALHENTVGTNKGDKNSALQEAKRILEEERMREEANKKISTIEHASGIFTDLCLGQFDMIRAA